MANSGKVWTFSQLGGDRKTLTLLGWLAPFGRPRRGAVVNAGIVVRKSVTYYPGKDVPPTVHVFGSNGKPFELHGRWMDQAIGTAGTVQKMVRDWKDFISDGWEVRAKWGDLLSYRILIHDFDALIESEAEVAWKLMAEVLVDEAAPVASPDIARKSPADYAGQCQALFTDVQTPFTAPETGSLLDILPEISDLFDSIVTSINAPFAAVFDTASALSDFETALSSDLVKMGSGLQTVRTGILELRSTSELFVARVQEMNNPGVYVEGGLFSGPDVLSLTAAKSTADVATANLLALIAEMQNDIDRTVRGQVQSAHATQDGDSWESIATRKLGSPAGARALKKVNAVRYGQKPVAGKTYIIPRSQ